jgi:hypothetical protein
VKIILINITNVNVVTFSEQISFLRLYSNRAFNEVQKLNEVTHINNTLKTCEAGMLFT